MHSFSQLFPVSTFHSLAPFWFHLLYQPGIQEVMACEKRVSQPSSSNNSLAVSTDGTGNATGKSSMNGKYYRINGSNKN